MIEGFCDLLTDEQMMAAVEAGSKAVAGMCVRLEGWAKEVGKPKDAARLVLLPEVRTSALPRPLAAACLSRAAPARHRTPPRALRIRSLRRCAAERSLAALTAVAAGAR